MAVKENGEIGKSAGKKKVEEDEKMKERKGEEDGEMRERGK